LLYIGVVSPFWFIANDKSWLKANKRLYSLCMAKKKPNVYSLF